MRCCPSIRLGHGMVEREREREIQREGRNSAEWCACAGDGKVMKRRLGEESEEAGEGSGEETELDGESTSGGVLDAVVTAGRTARASRAGAR